MFRRFRLFFDLYKEAKNAPEIPEVTEFLEKSKFFSKFSLGFHNLRIKAWQKLDEAAFPEEYENKKYLEHHKEKESTKQDMDARTNDLNKMKK